MPKHDHHKAEAHREDAVTSPDGTDTHRPDTHEKVSSASATQHSQPANDHPSKADEESKAAQLKAKGPRTL